MALHNKTRMNSGDILQTAASGKEKEITKPRTLRKDRRGRRVHAGTATHRYFFQESKPTLVTLKVPMDVDLPTPKHETSASSASQKAKQPAKRVAPSYFTGSFSPGMQPPEIQYWL